MTRLGPLLRKSEEEAWAYVWMGGNVPLGYDASERALVVNPAEAETVRRIFALYRELGAGSRRRQTVTGFGRSAPRP
jgi:DNA invertase Pin-like site-specific DNA recombinase